MTFDLCHAPPLAWQRPSSPLQSVNEVEDPGGMAGTVWRRGCQYVKLCGGGFAPPTQEVGGVVVMGVWWNVIVCLLVLSRLLALFVDFQWASGGW